MSNLRTRPGTKEVLNKIIMMMIIEKIMIPILLKTNLGLQESHERSYSS